MMRKRPRSWMQWARRASQAAFLGIFLWLALVARFSTNESQNPWLEAFFHFDPLIAAATWLATHTLTKVFLLSLITLAATLLFGRVFCGWVCPLGTLHAIASWFRRRSKARSLEVRSPWQRAKYLLLVALVIMAAFGCHWIGIFDPLSTFYRSIVTAGWPATQYAVEEASTAVYQSDPHLGGFHLTSITEPVYKFFRDRLFQQADRQTFLGGTLLGAFLLAILLLNLVRPRFWCRYICPLGAMLGLFSQRPALVLRKRAESCTNCGRCASACPAAAQPHLAEAASGEGWLPTECVACWNCVAACNQGGLSFGLGPPLLGKRPGRLDLSKRATIAAGLGGVAGLLTFRLPPVAQARKRHPELIRPPGARIERDFLKRCLQCGLCMRACPTNGLQPAALEAGIEGLWTPKLVPKIGYCEYNCNICGQVCPTEAIQPLALEEKQEIKIGLATVDITRCLPYAYGRECIICEEHCPVPTKAIYFVEREVELRDGTTRTVKQPQVDPDLCTGCGVCEWACIFQDRAAIRVTSANESRAPQNQPILPGADEGSPYGF